ncbi:hypothetical protein C8R45DRAFT_942328 [Mycena sanguinolenta]|nr:hypothetical protein C8R45DRAFT_942328 [Mycena sanguinolenta]
MDMDSPHFASEEDAASQNHKAELNSSDDDQHQWGYHHQFPPPARSSLDSGGMGLPEHASPPDMYVEQNTWPASPQQRTLNPGKIVCNKCGLYERTHLRARPLKFDQLRAAFYILPDPPSWPTVIYSGILNTTQP